MTMGCSVILSYVPEQMNGALVNRLALCDAMQMKK